MQKITGCRAYTNMSFFTVVIRVVFWWQHFLTTFKNRDDFIAPGLGLTAVIEYSARDEQEKSDVLVVTIDGCPVDIPIRAWVFSSIIL